MKRNVRLELNHLLKKLDSFSCMKHLTNIHSKKKREGIIFQIKINRIKGYLQF